MAQYDLAIPGSFRLIPGQNALPILEKDYNAMEQMIFGDVPSFQEILIELGNLESEINALT